MIQPRRVGSHLHKVFVFGGSAVAVMLLFEATTANAEDLCAMERMTLEIGQLREMLVHQQAEINELRSNRPADTASLLRQQDMVRELVRETINDVDIRSQGPIDGPQRF